MPVHPPQHALLSVILPPSSQRHMDNRSKIHASMQGCLLLIEEKKKRRRKRERPWRGEKREVVPFLLTSDRCHSIICTRPRCARDGLGVRCGVADNQLKQQGNMVMRDWLGRVSAIR